MSHAHRSKGVVAFFAAILTAALLSPGCAEDKLTGTPQNLPPGTMPAAPPLEQSPSDLAKTPKSQAKNRR